MYTQSGLLLLTLNLALQQNYSQNGENENRGPKYKDQKIRRKTFISQYSFGKVPRIKTESFVSAAIA